MSLPHRSQIRPGSTLPGWDIMSSIIYTVA